MKTLFSGMFKPPLIALQLIMCWPMLVHTAFTQFGLWSGLLEILAVPYLAVRLIIIWPYVLVASIVDWIDA